MSALVIPYNAVPCVFANQNSIWLAKGRYLFYTRGSLTGHRWKDPLPKHISGTAPITDLSVGMLYDLYLDYVWFVRAGKEVLGFQQKSKKLVSIPSHPSGNRILCVTGVLNVIWVLDAQGKIFLRIGIDPLRCPIGTSWKELDLIQLGDSTRLCHLSIALDSVWACDVKGKVYLRLGTGVDEAPGGLHVAWVPVVDDGSTVAFRQVHTSLDGRHVWGVSVTNHVYCRLGIMDGLPIGAIWVEVK